MLGSSDSPPFRAVVASADDGVTVRFSGELDLATAPEAEAAVAQARSHRPAVLRLDLSELTFLDSTGLRLALRIEAACRAEDCRLEVVPGPRGVQRVFELAGVLEMFPFTAHER